MQRILYLIPSPGTINMYNPPGGLGVRVDRVFIMVML